MMASGSYDALSGNLGTLFVGAALVFSLLTICTYVITNRRRDSHRSLIVARSFYGLTALCVLAAFTKLGALVYMRQYQYQYVIDHTGNELQGWYRLAATWAGQEGSFLLWATWTALIGIVVIARAGKYESRVLPIYASVLGFLAAILLKQSPFHMLPAPTAADLAINPGWHYPPLNGLGLNPSLNNYWMTIHPPTIFFGFASLAVPYCYAVAALIWKDYEGWTKRVMPWALLSSAFLGLGLMMGGYWAYETQGWHGFWAWDPVENASFFPWLAITALMHGLVVQKRQGGMGRTNTFLGILAFWLFLLGTFLTRSGALAGKDASGQMLSVHAFDNITKSGLHLMVLMLVGYGVLGIILWLIRFRSVPGKQTTGDTLLSRDFGFFMAVLLMLAACAAITLGTTRPLFLSWTHQVPDAPKAVFYNKIMLPVAMLLTFTLGTVPWLAWNRTDPDQFLKKVVGPWVAMLVFGFFMLFWVQSAERNLMQVMDPADIGMVETARAWISPMVQRVCVVLLATMGFFAAFSNAILAVRVFRRKPIGAGGWLAHVGIGVLVIGVIVSNTFERTVRIKVEQDMAGADAFGYHFAFDRMTGKPLDARPLNPDFDRNNQVRLTVTPPGGRAPDAAGLTPASEGGSFTLSPRWFVYNMETAASEDQLERMRWPSIKKFLGHDLYVGFADDPAFGLHAVDLKPLTPTEVGPYNLFYVRQVGTPGKYMGALLYMKTPDGRILNTTPGMLMGDGNMRNVDVTIPKLRDAQGNPGVIYLKRLDPVTKQASLLLSLPGFSGRWSVPLEVTYKPWVNLVWIGALLTTAGTLLAMTRRSLEPV